MTDSDDLTRVALEAFAVEGVRSGTLSVFQARELLGIQSRYEMDGVWKKHGVDPLVLLDQPFGRLLQALEHLLKIISHPSTYVRLLYGFPSGTDKLSGSPGSASSCLSQPAIGSNCA